MALLVTLNTTPIPGGYAYTLTTRLGHMLLEAEKLYGPRDLNYTILGVEFFGDHPQLWYPNNCKHIAIQLTPAASQDMEQGCYQLAHECIHLLTPTGRAGANVLEEGLATHFAHQYVLSNFQRAMQPTMAGYARAEQLARELLNLDPYAIKELRKVEPVISRITAQQMMGRYPALDQATAAALAAAFADNR